MALIDWHNEYLEVILSPVEIGCHELYYYFTFILC
jgi:hypothetical protein